jgi:hypothetical protein
LAVLFSSLTQQRDQRIKFHARLVIETETEFAKAPTSKLTVVLVVAEEERIEGFDDAHLGHVTQLLRPGINVGAFIFGVFRQFASFFANFRRFSANFRRFSSMCGVFSAILNAFRQFSSFSHQFSTFFANFRRFFANFWRFSSKPNVNFQ